MKISRIEMVLLAMIAKKPTYAYEIDQFIKETHMRRWLRIGSASVYQGLERLARKGMITSSREKEGNMPTRRRYSLTPVGKNSLKKATRDILSHCEDHYLDLTLGLFCSRVLPKGELPDLLKSRASELTLKCSEIASHKEIVDENARWQQEAIMSILIDFCTTEHTLLEKLTRQLESQG